MSETEASAWARQNGYAYVECSAQSGKNVQEVRCRGATDTPPTYTLDWSFHAHHCPGLSAEPTDA